MWLEQQVWKSSRRMLIASALLTALAAGTIANNWRVVRSYLQGPLAMPRSELFSVKSVDSMNRVFVSVRLDSLLDAHLWEERTIARRRGALAGQVTGHFYVGQIGSHLVLVRARAELPKERLGGLPYRVTGALEPVNGRAREALLKGLPNADEVRSRFHSLQIDTDFERNGHIVLGVFGLISVLVIGLGVLAVRRTIKPAAHPAYGAIGASTPEGVIAAASTIDSDLAAGRSRTLGGHLVTSRFLAKTVGATFTLKSFDDLVWAYIIRLDAAHALSLHFRGARPLVLQGPEQVCVEALGLIAEHAQWVVCGYSKDVDDAYRRDAAEFARRVALRRDESRKFWANVPEHSL